MEKDKASQELYGLLEHQKQLKDWLYEVEQRIFELEGTYLDETPNGNLVRGWDIDTKITRPRQIEGQERIFSCSSYQNWLESKSLIEIELENKKLVHTRPEQPAPKTKKARKSSSSKRDSAAGLANFDDGDEDY